MTNPTAKKLGCVLSLIGLVLFAVALVMAVRRGTETDRRLSAFCSSIPLKASLEAARAQAIAQGFIVTDATIEPQHPAINVSEKTSLWPESWCRLDHNGSSITGYSFNPWDE